MKRPKIAAVIGAIALAVLAQRLGLFRMVGEPALMRQKLVDLGAWGYAAYLFAFIFLQPIGIPGTIYVIAAALVWPWPAAFALSMTGSIGASVVGFSFTRFVARDWVEKRLPARFRRYDDAIAQRGFTTVFILRTIFWMAPWLHAVLGISRVRFWTHFWSTTAAFVVPLFLLCYFGQQAVDWMRAASLQTWILLGAGTVVLGALGWILQRRMNRRLVPDEAKE